MEKFIDIVYSKVQLKEGKSCIEKILISLYLNHKMSNKDLSRKVFLPIPVITAIKKEFIKLGLVIQKNGIQLTSLGTEYVESQLGYAGLDLNLFNELVHLKQARENLIAELSKKYIDIYNNRPQVNVEIDQALGTVDTAFKRAMLCLENETLIHKNILCVGDDDLVSIAIGLLLKHLYKGRIIDKSKMVQVLDIDERIVGYINELAKEHNLPVKAIQLNLREPLPISYASFFDAFFTDPPYTLDGMTLFLSRGISALKKERGLKVFLSFGQKAINEEWEVQQLIGKHGLVLSERIKGFNSYEGASMLGSFSEMMILDTTDSLKTTIQIDETYEKKIYTADFRKHVSLYECKSCKNIFQVGKQQKIRTIEELKKEGCPYCHEKVFRLKHNDYKNEIKEEKKALGQHILADFFDCSADVLGNVDLIERYMHEAAKCANATIVTEEFHKFKPWGVSGAVIIMESHLTIHTWPEYGYAAVDIFTCGNSLLLWDALLYLKEKMKSKKMDYNEISRGKFKTSSYETGVENAWKK